MPLYDMKCLSCGHECEVQCSIEESQVSACPSCQGLLEVQITCKNRDWFRPHWNENIDLNPIYIESKEHYKKECEKRGLQARCLL